MDIQLQLTHKLTPTGWLGQGRLPLSTDGDKCAMVIFLGGEQKSLILNFNMQKCEFCAQIQINNLQFKVLEIWFWCF